MLKREDIKDLEASVLTALYLNDSDIAYWKKVYIDSLIWKYDLEGISLIYKESKGKGYLYKFKLDDIRPMRRKIGRGLRMKYESDIMRVASELTDAYSLPGADISKFKPNGSTRSRFFEYDITTKGRKLKTPFIAIETGQKEFLDKLIDSEKT